jgi:DNA-binding transcriptional ArsR family regulator
MTMIATVVDVSGPVERSALDPAAALFRGFGDPTRLALLVRLFDGEQRVRDLTDHVGLAQSTVSEHLRCLLGCGLVQVRVEGRSSVYSLALEPELRHLLTAAEQVLAGTGDAVVLCPRSAPDTP